MAAPTFNDFRPSFAALFGKSGDAVLNRQKKAVSLMKEEAPPGQEFGLGVAFPLNSTNVGILMLDLLDAGPLQSIPDRVPRLWRAAYEMDASKETAPVCPVSGAGTVGQLFVALLDRPAVRDRLWAVQIEQETATVLALWKRPQHFSIFHPYQTVEERKRAVQEARRGVVHRLDIHAVLFTGVADLMLKYTLPNGAG